MHELHNVFANFKKMLTDTNLELSQQKFVNQGECLCKSMQDQVNSEI